MFIIFFTYYIRSLSYRQLVSMSCGMQLFHLVLHPHWSIAICQTSKFIVFRNPSVVFLNINNKRHISVHPKEDISFGKGVSFFLSSCRQWISMFGKWRLINVGVELSETIASHKTLTLVVGMTMILISSGNGLITIFGRCLWINRNVLHHFSFYLYSVQISNFATWSGLNFKTNVEVYLSDEFRCLANGDWSMWV
jgi:hypothetical protein